MGIRGTHKFSPCLVKSKGGVHAFSISSRSIGNWYEDRRSVKEVLGVAQTAKVEKRKLYDWTVAESTTILTLLNDKQISFSMFSMYTYRKVKVLRILWLASESFAAGCLRNC